MTVDVSDETVKGYQIARLKEKAAPKSINEETGILMRLLGDRGDLLRIRMRRQKTLKLASRGQVARAFAPEERVALLAAAKKRRSPAIHPAVMLALHVGMRDAEIRDLQWARVDLHSAIVKVGESKTVAGQGRPIPLNSDVLAATVQHSKWYEEKFGERRPEWYVLPFGKPLPTDPSRPVTSFKTAWGELEEGRRCQGPLAR
jgi:integrase